MMFYGFLAMLPREDFPPSFIRPFEEILGRSFNYESNDNCLIARNNPKSEEHRKFTSSYQIIEGVIKHSVEQFITNLDTFVQLVGYKIL